jgi:hypothetical protein
VQAGTKAVANAGNGAKKVGVRFLNALRPGPGK